MAAVLVVDDDPDSAEILAKFLERGGHEPVVASNGWEALLALDMRKIDLVLLDLSMPGMDGATFLGILRNDRRRANLPVILVTAMRDVGQYNRASKLGVSDCLLKSRFTMPDLFLAVSGALEAAAGPHGDRAN